VDAVLHLQSLVLNLKKEIFFAEKIAIKSGRRPRRVVVPFRQPLGHFALQASRKPDQPLRMFRQKFLAHPRLVVEAVQRSLRRDLHQIAIAFFVFGQHQQVVISVAVGRSARDDVIVLLADVELASDDRLDPTLCAAFTKCTAPKILPWSVMATAGMPS
jgi:hypothetical protein